MTHEVTNAAMAVLEEILERAVDECREAMAEGNTERAKAFFEVIDNAKNQAKIMGIPAFSNTNLEALDPYTLLEKIKRAA